MSDWKDCMVMDIEAVLEVHNQTVWCLSFIDWFWNQIALDSVGSFFANPAGELQALLNLSLCFAL